MDVCSMGSLLSEKSNRLAGKFCENEIHKINGCPNKSLLTLDELIGKLHEAFATNDVNIDYVQDLMATYRSNPQEWRKYAKFDRYR